MGRFSSAAEYQHPWLFHHDYNSPLKRLDSQRNWEVIMGLQWLYYNLTVPVLYSYRHRRLHLLKHQEFQMIKPAYCLHMSQILLIWVQEYLYCEPFNMQWSQSRSSILNLIRSVSTARRTYSVHIYTPVAIVLVSPTFAISSKLYGHVQVYSTS